MRTEFPLEADERSEERRREQPQTRLQGLRRRHGEPLLSPGSRCRKRIREAREVSTCRSCRMIRIMVYHTDTRFVTTPHLTELPKVLADEGVTAWVDVGAYAAEELDAVAQVLALHPLAVEECRSVHQRPTIHVYADQVFVESAVVESWTPEGLLTNDVQGFLKSQLVITVHEEVRPEIDALWDLEMRNPTVIAEGPDAVLRRMLKEVVNRYFPLVEKLREYLEGLEDDVFEGRDDALERIAEIRKHTQRLRGLLDVQCQVLREVCGEVHPLIDDRARVYLRDVYADALRAESGFAELREHVNSLRELHVSVTSKRMSEKVQALTTLATVLVPLTLIAGIYGMNFERIPLGSHPWGFWVTLGGMACLGGGMWAILRWRRLT
jgi:magnesium transporter